MQVHQHASLLPMDILLLLQDLPHTVLTSLKNVLGPLRRWLSVLCFCGTLSFNIVLIPAWQGDFWCTHMLPIMRTHWVLTENPWELTANGGWCLVSHYDSVVRLSHIVDILTNVCGIIVLSFLSPGRTWIRINIHVLSCHVCSRVEFFLANVPS